MLQGFTTSFGQRLRAMAHAHSLLTRSRWEGADLRSLLEEEVRAHEAHRHTAARTRLTGPEVMLRPKAALALSMAVHELVTNAAKYGALSVPDGIVEVTWALSGNGDGNGNGGERPSRSTGSNRTARRYRRRRGGVLAGS